MVIGCGTRWSTLDVSTVYNTSPSKLSLSLVKVLSFSIFSMRFLDDFRSLTEVRLFSSRIEAINSPSAMAADEESLDNPSGAS